MIADGSDPGRQPADTTILVVDDDPVVLTLVARTLRAEGYRVWAANGPAEARRVLADLPGGVHLLLTDVMMPEELGSELAAQIRATQRWVHVLYMSTTSPKELREQGIDIPESRFVQKPLIRDQLIRKIREVLSA